jgi:hypothetical protein
MRLSESIRRKVLEISAGWIVNKFKIRKRRDTLFFEDIIAEYFRRCEAAGFGNEMEELGREWMALYFTKLLPDSLKKAPPDVLLNSIISRIWSNLGLMDNFFMAFEGDMVRIKTINEGVTRIVGTNRGMVGFHKGIINALFGRAVETVEFNQKKENCAYAFRLLEGEFGIEGKDKEMYNKLNQFPEDIRGFNLKDAVENGVFVLKAGNRIYFKEKLICPVENTISHLIGNKGVMLDSVAHISERYFSGILKEKESKESRLTLLRLLLESMGWGLVRIMVDKKERITVIIKNPPYGLQSRGDNWNFLSNTILGYLRTIDKRYIIKSTKKADRKLTVTYSA